MKHDSSQRRELGSAVTGKPSYASSQDPTDLNRDAEFLRRYGNLDERKQAALLHEPKDSGANWDGKHVKQTNPHAYTLVHAPHRTYPIDPVPRTVRETYDEIIGAYRTLGITVDAESELYQSLRGVLDTMAKQLGVDSEQFLFDVVRSPEENMFIIHSKELDNPHIVAFTGLLVRMAQEFGVIKRGNLALVKGHEIGHFLEGHYGEVGKEKKESVEPAKNENRDPIPVEYLGRFGIKDAEDLLRGRIFHQDQESPCDEHALRGMAELGEPLGEGIEVLEMLNSMEREHSAQQSVNQKRRKRGDTVGAAVRSMTKTHPAGAVRVFRGKGLIRELEVERGRPFPKGAKRREPLVSALDPNLQPTPVQEVLSQLAIAVDPLKDKAKFPYEKVGKIVEQTDSLEALKHLLLLVPAIEQTHHYQVPTVPFGSLRAEPPDRALPASAIRGAPDILSTIMERFEEVALQRRAQIEASESESKERELLKLEMEQWLYLSCMHPCEGSEARLTSTVLPALRKDPALAIELVEELGKQHFDLSCAPKEWIKDLLNCSSMLPAERGVVFATIEQQSFIDVRADLLTRLLAEGLLDEVESIEGIQNFVERCRKHFTRDSGRWIDPELPVAIGENLSIWADIFELPLNSEGGSPSVAKLLARITPESSNSSGQLVEGDPIVVEVAGRLLSSASALSFEDRMDWLSKTFEPGRQRDMLVFRLIEEETELFKKIASKQVMELSLPPDIWQTIAPEQIKDYIAIFEQAFPLLDLKWFQPTLKKRDVGEAYSHHKNHYNSTYELEGFPMLSTPEGGSNYSPLLARLGVSDCFWLEAPLARDENIARYYVRSYLHLKFPPHDFVLDRNIAIEGDGISGAQYFARVAELGLSAIATDSRFDTDHLSEAIQEDLAGLTDLAERESQPNNPSLFKRAMLLHGLGTSYYQAEPESLLQVTDDLPAGEFQDYIILRGLSAHLQREEVAKAIISVCGDLLRTNEILGYRQGAERETGFGSTGGYEDDRLRNLEGYLRKMVKLYEQLEARVTGRGGLSYDPEEYQSEFDGRYSMDNAVEVREEFIEKLRVMKGEAKAGAEDVSEYDTVLQLLGRLQQPSDGRSVQGGGTTVSKLLKLEQLQRVYEDYQLFMRMDLQCDEALFSVPDTRLVLSDMEAIKTLVGDAAFARYHEHDKKEAFNRLSVQERLDILENFYPVPSSEKDRHLIDMFDEDLKERLTEGEALRVYNSLYSELYRVDAGRKIYEAHLLVDSGIVHDFEKHLSLILSTHPEGSVSREATLRKFFDGEPGEQGTVRTFAERNEVLRLLELEKGNSSDTKKLVHAAAATLLEDALNSSWVGSRDKVDTILWLASLKDKPHLVRCLELLQGVDSKEFKGVEERLSDQQKLKIVKTVLAGPGGVLTDTSPEARKHFLDALFISVFKEDGMSEEKRRSFKAVYDCMMHYISPERASDVLGNFLIAHLKQDEPTFNDQVKLFFESFGFIGAKTAQYLVRNTSTLPEDLREILMELTSRVEGKDKRLVFDALERSYGEDAENIVYDVGERVGGGSLMVFYKVRLWNKDHTGPDEERGEGVIGVLRPDIVCSLPEDLHLIHRIVESMHTRPELFGDMKVSKDLVHSLIGQSIEETDLKRLVSVQKAMAKDVADFMKQHPNCNLQMSIPRVWDRHVITNEEGEEKRVSLCRGSVVMMEHAPGLTLDLFAKKCRSEGAEGMAKLSQVHSAVADLFLEQITSYGRVHADLHPGNIIVDDSDGLHVNIVDVGLSTKLGQTSREAIKKLMRIGVGSSQVAEEEGIIGRFKEGILKKAIGLGRVDAREGQQWIASALNVFESLVGESWDEQRKEHAVQEIWKILDNRTELFQQKLTAIVETAQELDLYLPQEFYYVLRGIDTLSYVWQKVDWKKKARDLRDMLKADAISPTLPELDADLIIPRVEEIAERLGVTVDLEQVEQAIAASNEEDELLARLTRLKEGLVGSVQTEQRTSEIVREIEQLLISDDEIRDQYGLTETAEKLGFFFAQSRKERAREHHPMFQVEPLQSEVLSQAADDDRFGYQARVWRRFLHSGTLLRVAANGDRPPKAYAVSTLNNFHFENVEYTPVVPVDEGVRFFVFRDMRILEPEGTHLTPEESVEHAKVQAKVEELKAFVVSRKKAEEMLETGEISQAVYDAFIKRGFDDDAEEERAYAEDWVQEMVESDSTQAEIKAARKMIEVLTGKEPFDHGREQLAMLIKRNAVYPFFENWIWGRQHPETTTIGDLIAQHGLEAVEVAGDDGWIPITDLMISVGESETAYHRHVARARESLAQ
ncbi:MAG: M48 family metalloprotease [Bdellovibrionales bacterium]|nr:M48 family metalloprotease [Bdellovibrionales bacterium]